MQKFWGGAVCASLVALAGVSPAHAGIQLLGIGSLGGSSAGINADLSGLTGPLESGKAGNFLGGLGSGLAWAGGSTFLALPDRGPNAESYLGGAAVDQTTSYISRFQTLNIQLQASTSGSGLPMVVTPTLTATTLLYSGTPVSYGSTAGLPSGTPAINTADKYYFSGRSDNFSTGNTGSANFGRLDPEGIRVSNDGRSVFVSDEYGPYVYRFDRQTGERLQTYTLPSWYSANNPNAIGATEISGNTFGRVANKGMEGLAITPDGKTLMGFMQSPLAQDGGDGGRYNRIVSIDVASGATKEWAYDNRIGSKNYNSSEILALNSHEFLVLERDGKGLGDGSAAVVKQIYKYDLDGVPTIADGVSGASNLATLAASKTLFLDVKASLNGAGFADNQIPAKIEGMAFGEDVVVNGQTLHTMYVVNDNDFVPDVAGPNRVFVFGFTDADLGASRNGAASVFVNQSISPVPEPAVWAQALVGLFVAGAAVRRRARSAR